MSQFPRTAKVALGLAAAGTVIGGICAITAMVVILATEAGLPSFADLRDAYFREVFALFAIPAGIGAIAGAIGAPLLGFGLLRRVRLGQSILFTAIGAVVGASLGEWARPWNPYSRTVPGAIIGALLGFLVAGIILRLRPGRNGTIVREPVP